MTAIVGVLNKHAVAIAADSAVTMGNTHKVVNSANKIFTLSKYHPVAVMTYSNAAFMGVPWDIIIKEYRKNLGKKSFEHLKEYVDDFISFLHVRKFFSDDKTHRSILLYILETFFNICKNDVAQKDRVELSDVPYDKLELEFSNCLNVNRGGQKCPEFASYDYKDFYNYAHEMVETFCNGKGFGNTDLLCESFFNYLSVRIPTDLQTGLVFVGYGESEIYPSLYPINVFFAFDNHLRYYYDETNVAEITEHGHSAFVSPFAQIDVTQTIMSGINPSFQKLINNVIENSFSSFSGQLATILEHNPKTASIAPTIRNFDFKPIVNNANVMMKRAFYDSYTKLLMKTVISLDKEDMANMAESFIALTSLVRRMSPGEETVGGPVDVAVISKGDGFVWINRKHYFKPELNTSFFSNYFK